MENVILNPWMSALIVFISQFVFLYLRTLNVMYTADRRVFLAILIGVGIGIAWLVSIAIGVKSVLNFEIPPLVAYLVGSALGTWWGFVTDKKHRNDKS
jgi:uncharacterized protein YebE (UPF0316 family)